MTSPINAQEAVRVLREALEKIALCPRTEQGLIISVALAKDALTATADTAAPEAEPPSAYLRVSNISQQVRGVFLPSEDMELKSERLVPLYRAAPPSQAIAEPAQGEAVLSEAEISAICKSIKYGDGWSGEQWDHALAHAVEIAVRRKFLQSPASDAQGNDSVDAQRGAEYIPKKAILDAFGKTDWVRQKFNFDGRTIEVDGENQFFKCRDVDAAIAKLNELLHSTQKDKS